MSDHQNTGIRTEIEGEIAIVTIDNEKRRNAMGRAMRQALRDSVQHLMNGEPDVRALVITGAGAHFCAGADISEMGQKTITLSREILAESCQVVRLMTAGRKPVIAAVEGVAFGAGLSLVCAADYVVAARDARFCAAFLRIGLLPDTAILGTLHKKVGPAKARELMALAPEIDAPEAARIGLVSRVTEPGGALAEAVGLARELARNPPLGMALIKAALTLGNDSMGQSLHTEMDYQAMARVSADHQEAARAFVEKRKPQFTGR